MIRFACPKRQKVYETADKNAGKKSCCKSCSSIAIIPNPITDVYSGLSIPLGDVASPDPFDTLNPSQSHAPEANPFADLTDPPDPLRPMRNDQAKSKRDVEDDGIPIRSRRTAKQADSPMEIVGGVVVIFVGIIFVLYCFTTSNCALFFVVAFVIAAFAIYAAIEGYMSRCKKCGTWRPQSKGEEQLMRKANGYGLVTRSSYTSGSTWGASNTSGSYSGSTSRTERVPVIRYYYRWPLTCTGCPHVHFEERVEMEEDFDWR